MDDKNYSNEFLDKTINVCFHNIVSRACLGVYAAEREKGIQLASDSNIQGAKNAVYYNSNDYYLYEEIKAHITECLSDYVEQQNLEVSVKLNPPVEFNKIWSDECQNNLRRATMLNTEAVPPKDFSFLYVEKGFHGTGNSSGTFWMKYGASPNSLLDILMDIPFTYVDTEDLADCYNLSRLLKMSNLNSSLLTDEVKSFMSNFYIYPKCMTASRGIDFVQRSVGRILS